ncbi:MAG: 50S ribosomal protein L13 [Candidatus Berkelbacteria bacterium]
MPTKKPLSNQSTNQNENQVNKTASEKPKVVKPVVREFDAAGQVLGRLATKIAVVLRGKDKPGFRPYMICGEKVKVINASKIVLTGRKIDEKKYYHHTGYIGNLKTVSVKELMAKNPAEIIERAVYGMIPDNKLRKEIMKNLEITN